MLCQDGAASLHAIELCLDVMLGAIALNVIGGCKKNEMGLLELTLRHECNSVSCFDCEFYQRIKFGAQSLSEHKLIVVLTWFMSVAAGLEAL